MRHIFTREQCSKGGRTRSQQPTFVEGCRKGFQITMERHPFFARKHLKHLIKAYNTGNVQRKEEHTPCQLKLSN